MKTLQLVGCLLFLAIIFGIAGTLDYQSAIEDQAYYASLRESKQEVTPFAAVNLSTHASPVEVRFVVASR